MSNRDSDIRRLERELEDARRSQRAANDENTLLRKVLLHPFCFLCRALVGISPEV